MSVYSSKNVWIDHSTFYSTLTNQESEVGKFVWINTPYNGYDKSRSPDYVTVSYNIFRNRYWCLVYGTQNGVITEDQTTVMYNLFDSDVRRQPEIGNGTVHTFNNYLVHTTIGADAGADAAIIVDKGARGISEANRFESFRQESTGYWDFEFVIGDSLQGFVDSASYSNKSASGSTSTSPALCTPTSTCYYSYATGNYSTTWRPSANYGYLLMNAYNSSGANDAKSFCKKYSGSQTTYAALQYSTYSGLAAYVTKTVNNPFLVSIPVTVATSSSSQSSSSAMPSSSSAKSSSSSAMSSSISSSSLVASSSSVATSSESSTSTTTSISAKSPANDFNIHLVHKVLAVSSEEGSTIDAIDVYDIFGVRLLHEQSHAMQASVDMNSWNAGVYLVRVYSSSASFAKTIILN